MGCSRRFSLVVRFDAVNANVIRGLIERAIVRWVRLRELVTIRMRMADANATSQFEWGH